MAEFFYCFRDCVWECMRQNYDDRVYTKKAENYTKNRNVKIEILLVLRTKKGSKELATQLALELTALDILKIAYFKPQASRKCKWCHWNVT